MDGRTSWTWNGCALGLVLCGMVGCTHVDTRVEHPPIPTLPAAENDLIRVESLGATRSKDGTGLLAVRVTNKADHPISIGGHQDASLPAKNGGKAWLVYRGSESISRYARSEVTVQLNAGDANVELDVPEEGESPLGVGASRTVLVRFEADPNADQIEVDLSPVVVGSSVHRPDGELRALYLAVPFLDARSLKTEALKWLNQTKVGFQLTSDDVM